MAGVFEDIELSWNGVDYTVPASRALPAIARIEDIITLHELAEYSARGTAPMGKLAQAYGAVLRYAGADLTDEDVYVGMFSSDGSGQAVMLAINGLLAMMVPPSEQLDGGGQEKKASQPRKRKRRRNRSSGKRTRHSSATAG